MLVERVEAYDEMLDEVYGTVTIAGITFNASDILAKLDPIAYNCYAGDWMGEEEEEE